MLKVTVENYKTIRNLTVVVDGYTVVTGPNFVGKSALFSAIFAALDNKEGTSFITWGEKHCRVVFEHNGFKVEWYKSATNSYYCINDGEKLTKIGSQPLAQVLQAGYGPSEFAGEKVYFNFVKQFESLFITNQTGREWVTDLLSQVMKADELYKATELVKKDIVSERTNTRSLEKQLAQEEELIKPYAAVPSLEVSVDSLDAALKEINQSSELVKTLNQLQTQISSIHSDPAVEADCAPIPDIDVSEKASELDSLRRLSFDLEDTSRKISSIPDGLLEIQDTLVSLASDIAVLNNYKELQSSLKITADSIRATPNIEEVVTCDIYKNLEEFEKLTALDNVTKDVRSTLDRTPELIEVPEITTPDLSIVKELERLYLDMKEVADEARHLASAQEVTYVDLDIGKPETLQELVNDLKATKNAVVSAEEELEQLSIEATEVAQELGGFQECPTCGQKLGESHAHD